VLKFVLLMLGAVDLVEYVLVGSINYGIFWGEEGEGCWLVLLHWGWQNSLILLMIDNFIWVIIWCMVIINLYLSININIFHYCHNN
jgi:hypothetical protein